jgi:dUTP pyrophosphatase
VISISETDLARLLQENIKLSEQVTELQARGTELLLAMRAATKHFEIEVPIRFPHAGKEACLFVPKYYTDGAAGLDLCTTTSQHLIVGGWCRLPTGVSLELPVGYVAKVVPRSSVTMRGLLAIDGTIDSDYRGEISIVLYNFGHEAVQIQAGSRVAQLLVMPVVRAKLVEVEALAETARGEAGFGSTGG